MIEVAVTAPDDIDEPKAVAHCPLATAEECADWTFVKVVVEP